MLCFHVNVCGMLFCFFTHVYCVLYLSLFEARKYIYTLDSYVSIYILSLISANDQDSK